MYTKELATYQQTAKKATDVTTKMAFIHEAFFACFALSVALLKVSVVYKAFNLVTWWFYCIVSIYG